MSGAITEALTKTGGGGPAFQGIGKVWIETPEWQGLVPRNQDRMSEESADFVTFIIS